MSTNNREEEGGDLSVAGATSVSSLTAANLKNAAEADIISEIRNDSKKFLREDSLDVNSLLSGGSTTAVGGGNNTASATVLSSSDDATDLNLPPGRMNAVKGTHRLQGSGSNLNTLQLHPHHHRTGSSGSGNYDGTTGTGGGTHPRSRSQSPSMKDRGATTTMMTAPTSAMTHDGNSSISSIDDIDSDLLTDRAGMCDADLVENVVRRMHNSRELLNLPPTVNERMSEDTLEDTLAFSDCQCRSSNASRVSVVSSAANEAVLEPLDECEEGLEDSDYSDNEGDEEGDGTKKGDGQHHYHKNHHHNHPTIILTNMENLNLHQQRIIEEGEGVDDNDNGDDDDDDDDYGGGIRASESSTQGCGQSSTAPTT